jgi:hypothetical protein
MVKEEKTVSFTDAKAQVEVAITRIALLHLAFSRVLVEQFGQEKGKELIIKSIMEYGKMIGERTMQRKQDLPKYGIYEKFEDGKAYGCVFAKIFHEYKEEDLGCLYCYVDAAKSMTVNPKRKLIHKECDACGDDYCFFESIPTTEKEQHQYVEKDVEWKNVDPRLVEGIKRRL